MEKPFEGFPTTKNQYIKVLDLYLSNVVHNPIFTSLAVFISFSYLQSKQWDWLMISSNNFKLIFMEDYKFDILSNIINLIFILRFVYYIKLNLFGEIMLFLLQNFACYKYILDKNGLSFLHDDDISSFLKSCIILQMLFPWLILISSLLQKITWKKSLTDCNNNYLPLFMSQSFMFINITFPLLSDDYKNYELLYKLACFSFKFYLIFQFVLYELVLINYELEDIKDYSVYYRDVTCYNEKTEESTGNFDLIKKYALTVVIVKLKTIQLTPKNPSVKDDSWFVEAAINEDIVVTIVYCYGMENVSQSSISFRTRIKSPEFELFDNFYPNYFYGLYETCPRVKEVGISELKEGTIVIFPNMYQHQFDYFELKDKTKPGYINILYLYLVDSYNGNFISSDRVPPQQEKCWNDSRLNYLYPEQKWPRTSEEAEATKIQSANERNRDFQSWFDFLFTVHDPPDY